MDRPNSYLVNPKAFGTRQAVWAARGAADKAGLAAAKVQHDFSLASSAAIAEQYGSVRSYCDATSCDYQRLTRILRGDLRLRVDDIGQAIVNLGLSVRFASRYSQAANELVPLAGVNEQARDAAGAFYTPDDVARYMVGRLVSASSTHMRVLEPSFGDGAFVKALRSAGIGSENITAVELDEAACSLAAETGILPGGSIVNVDFFDYPTAEKFDIAVGNPPYVRIRKMTPDQRAKALSIGHAMPSLHLGEEASTWLPFAAKCVAHLRTEGAMALVLPYELTYVRYARQFWTLLGSSFGLLEVIRVHDRIFKDLMQDVVLLLCFSRGERTKAVRYRCFENVSDLFTEKTSAEEMVSIDQVANGARAFQQALVPTHVRNILSGDDLVKAASECAFHIGYVCGNKRFFHPNEKTITQWSLPDTSLKPTAISSRRLASSPLRTSQGTTNDYLWLPEGEPTEKERGYIQEGERLGVNSSYKCRKRDPWWRVPSVKTPDLILSVFADSPRLHINDEGWTFSNSLLGGYLAEDVTPERFVQSWYTVLTLLTIETEVHSLGGGVLVLVPREAGAVCKMPSTQVDGDADTLTTISEALVANDPDKAYHAGDRLLASVYGETFVSDAWDAVRMLRSWRHPGSQP